MSDSGDHVPEMSPTPLLDDRAIDALVDGDDVAGELRHLVAFASGVRATGDRPAPRPSPALTALLASGGAAAAPAVAGGAPTPEGHRGSRRHLALAKVAGLGVAAKIGIGVTAAAAGVVGAGAGGLLPGDAGRMVRDAIEVVTPLELHDRDGTDGTGGTDGRDDTDGDDPAGGASDPGGHGDRVSSDATGESDGVPGVDGPEISQDAPGATRRQADLPDPAGTPGAPADVETPTTSRPQGEPGRPADPQPPVGPVTPPSTVPALPSSPPTSTGG